MKSRKDPHMTEAATLALIDGQIAVLEKRRKETPDFRKKGSLSKEIAILKNARKMI